MVITHNHPGGGPFSLADFRIMAASGASEIRAFGTDRLGRKWLYRFYGLSQEWQNGEKLQAVIIQADQMAQAEYETKMDGRNPVHADKVEQYHRRCEILADLIGAHYERKRV